MIGRSRVALHETDAGCARTDTGELRLLAAVLGCAIKDARRGRADALAWIESDASGRAERGFNYLDVCAVLGLDPGWTRTQVALRARTPGRRTGRRWLRLRAA